MEKSLISLLGGVGRKEKKKEKGEPQQLLLLMLTKIYLLEFTSVTKSLIPK